MARRRNHHLKSNESASSGRSATAVTIASSKLTNNNNNNNSHSNNNNNNKTCPLSNESRTSFKRNGIRVPSEEEEEEEEAEEEEEEAEEEDESEEEEAGGGVDVPPDDDEDAAAAAEDAEDDGSEHVRSNNNNSNNKKKRINRRRRKRLGRPPQSLSMDDISMVQVSNGSGSGSSSSSSRNLTNGHHHHQTYECPTCHLLVESASEFTRHIRQHNAIDVTATNSHSCSLCGKVLSSASSLDRHMLVHSGERPFKCSRCEMAFTTNGNMHRHMRTHHDNGNQPSSSPLLNNGNVSGDDDNNNNNNNSRKSRGVPIKRKLQLSSEASSNRRATPGAGRRNLWSTKRSRMSQADNNNEEVADGAEDEAEPAENDEMVADNSLEDLTLQCPLCNKGFLCKSGLQRHLESYPEADLKCKECGDNFETWQSLVNHLRVVHVKGVEASAVILGADGGNLVNNNNNNNNNSINNNINNNNNNNKAVATGFHDLTFVDFSMDKFALIAKSECEKHERRPSSAHHAFQCHHCRKAFPCSSSLKMHSKTSHTLQVNGKSNSSSSSSPPPPTSLSTTSPSLSSTCLVCHAAFATRRQLETHSLRHQNTEHCATPYSKNSSRDNRKSQETEQQHIVDPATADLAPEMTLSIDKQSFLALLELQSKKEDDHSDVEEDDDVHSSKNKRNNSSKLPKVTDIQPNDLADIQTILAVTSSTTMNIIPSMMMMGSSPAVTRPSSSRSSDSPTSPRLADSVTASPELPSPNQNQSTMSEARQAVTDAANNQNGSVDEVCQVVQEVPEAVESNVEAPSISSISDSLSNALVVDLSAASGWTPVASASGSCEKVTVRNVSPRRGHYDHHSIHGYLCNSQRQEQLQQQQQFPRDEPNSLRSLINLTNCTAFDPPQDQPLDLVLQPIDLTVNNSKKNSSTPSADNCSSSSASASSSSSSSSSSSATLPIDLSASTRQRSSSVINQCISPLMTSTPSAAIRRIPSLVSPQLPPSQTIPTQQPNLFDTSSSPFPTRFAATILTESSYVTNGSNVSQAQRFVQDGVRRPIALQPTSQQHPVISNVADSVVPLTLVRQNTFKSLKHGGGGPSTSSGSSSSGFLLKKQKQRRYRTERPFKCTYCAAGFTLRSNMERHIKQQHPEFWASKSRGRKERSLAPSNAQPSTSSSPNLPIAPAPLPQPRLIHPVPVPNVAFPSIPPPLNVTEYNPVLAAAANNSLAHSRPPLVLARSPSPPSVTLRLSTAPSVASLNKSSGGTISKELKQVICNQIKQKQNIESSSSTTSSSSVSSTVSSIPYANIKLTPSMLDGVGDPAAIVSLAHLAGDSNVIGRLMSGGNVRHIWRPAPQMEANANNNNNNSSTPVVEDGGDLASVSELLDRANQQSIQDLFRKRSREDEDDDENEEDNNSGGGHRTEESEEDQPLASLKSREQSSELRSKTPERSKDGRKSAYGNAPNRVACPYCYRQFPWTSSLRRHVLTHTGQKPFKCPKCPLWFTTKSNCDRHLSRKHGGGNAQSDVCEAGEGPTASSTATNSNVSPALNGGSSADCTARNAPDRPYRCHHCLSSTFSTPGNLQKHMMTKHPNQLSAAAAAVRTGSHHHQKETSSSSSTAVSAGATTTSVQGERSGESSSGSERCWGGESEESGEDLMINETGQQDEALFVCFVCLKSFAERAHCLEHLRERHPDEHGFLNNADNGQTVTANDEASTSDPKSSESPECSPDDDDLEAQ